MTYSSEPLSIDYNTAHNIPKPPLPYVPETRFHPQTESLRSWLPCPLSGIVCGHENIVAKFYHPLYYDHYSDNVDPFLCAD